MSFAEVLARHPPRRIRERLRGATPARVASVLAQERVREDDLSALFSPAADAALEAMARRAARITAHRFGRVVQLYAPLYLSNHCVNDCAYCGFARRHRVERRKLSTGQALAEAEVLREKGFRHLLLVSGEAPRVYGVGDLEEVARGLAGRFASIGIEVFPMGREDYGRLSRAGVDSLTLYQETYDRDRYRELHHGPKADFDARLTAVEAGGEAAFRTLGIGALLGLSDWREEAVAIALHGRWLMKRFWRSRVAASFPRLRPASEDYSASNPVTDRDLVHMMVAMRLALPDAEIVISTREPANLRDRLLPLGVTRMSAGSRTDVGGYRRGDPAGEQFAVDDRRRPDDVARAIAAAGREPVWKDFDEAFRETREP